MNKTITLLLVLFALSLNAQIPQTINWQGIIQDANGNNLDGNYNITVKLFDVGTGGTAVWTETQNTMAITDGMANIVLGSLTELDISFDRQYWLEITVGGGIPMPRIKLQSVPYALSSIEKDPTWGGSNVNSGSIYRNGNLGLGTELPLGLIHTYGIGTAEGNILFEGKIKTSNPGDPPINGIGTRMMWYPDKAAFRVGHVDNLNWDKNNIGIYSIAMGFSTKASGATSTALGYGGISSGDHSVSIGFLPTASGSNSIAMAAYSSASGTHSVAIGLASFASGSSSMSFGVGATSTGEKAIAFGCNTISSGSYATTMGDHTISKSGFETTLGRFNTDYTPISTTDWDSNDRLFVIGNGSSADNKSNAFTILKNGRIGLQTVTNPTFALELPNSAADGIGKGRANAWTTYSDGRIKSERKEIIYGLKEIMMLSPLSYYQHNSIFNNGKLVISDKGTYSFGFIAQDIFKIIPEIVSRPENENIGLWSLSYEKLTPILVKAIQEQQEIIDNQKKKNDSQDMLIQIQNQKIEELEKKLEFLMKNFNSNK